MGLTEDVFRFECDDEAETIYTFIFGCISSSNKNLCIHILCKKTDVERICDFGRPKIHHPPNARMLRYQEKREHTGRRNDW